VLGSLALENDGLTIKKHGQGGPPRIKSSHERVLEGGTGKKKTRAPRGAAPRTGVSPRARSAAPSAHAEPRDRARGLKKTRAPGGEMPASPDRSEGWSVASESARQRATAIAVAALDKKAVGLEILDVAGKVDYADFLVIMTGRSDRHALALAQGIEEALRKQGVRPVAVEGLPHGSWVLMDFGDVVVHVFQDDARRVYDIEGLWLDARRLPVPAEQQPE
jgi:ribosome-associated protein